MQIVIDIPDKIYKELTETAIMVTEVYPLTIERALTEGIVLPKGHGALADVKSFIKEVCIGSDDMADDWCDNDCANCEYTDNIRTLFKHIVVEADKEVGE